MYTETTESTTGLLNAAESLLGKFNETVEAINAAGEDGAVKRLADAMAEVLKAVAEKIKTA
jgi:mannose/fructose-specific phosphotransferase system component IIA